MNFLKGIIVLVSVYLISACSNDNHYSKDINNEQCTKILTAENNKAIPSSKEFNKTGYQFYKSHNYQKAIKFFKCAVNIDSENHYAHYNLACSLAILYKTNQKINIQNIINHLTKAKNSHPRYHTKIPTDKNLNALRDNPEFKNLITTLNAPKKTIQELIIGDWYSNPKYSPCSLKLNSDHSMVFQTHPNYGITAHGKWIYNKKSSEIELEGTSTFDDLNGEDKDTSRDFSAIVSYDETSNTMSISHGGNKCLMTQLKEGE